MKETAGILLTLSVLLVIGIATMGCSSSSDSAATTVVTTETTIAPAFSAGDVVASSSSPTSAWLIISYDSSTDEYTRAYIYKNTDGSWGYRLNANTETSSRTTMEKVYKVKVTHVTVSSIPTAQPTTIVTTTVTTRATTVATTATATTAPKPSFKDMDPDSGYAGDSVSSTITGNGFVETPTVKLTKSGSSTITASSVSWDSATQIEATFDIPNTTAAGIWNVVITNPDGQSLTYANEFTVHEYTDDE